MTNRAHLSQRGATAPEWKSGRAEPAIIALVALLAIAVIGWVMVSSARARRVTQAATPPMSVPDAAGNTQDVVASAPGITEPPSRVIQLSCDRTGIITAINAKSGQHVTKDQVLVQLDDAEAEADLAYRQAELAVEEAALADLKAWTRPEEIDEDKADVEAKKADATYGETDFERQTELRKTDAGTVFELARALAVRDETQANLKKSQAALAKDLDGPTPTQLAEAEARVDETRASVENERVSLQHRALKSPVDGTVLYVHMQPGEAIDLHSPQPILSIAEAGPMHLRAEVDEADIGKISVSQKVLASSDAYDQTFAGTVVSMEPMMGRQYIRVSAPTEQPDARIREVVIQLQADAAHLPFDLTMTVRFLRPPPDLGSAAPTDAANQAAAQR